MAHVLPVLLTQMYCPLLNRAAVQRIWVSRAVLPVDTGVDPFMVSTPHVTTCGLETALVAWEIPVLNIS
jgi:hypothetical protein